ncbi:MAG: XdhC family protein, partial [Anaerolineae bacterium]
ANGRPHILNYALVSPERGDPGLCGGEVEVYLEPYLPPATVYIFGCGHVGQALAAQARLAGFRVVVSDDRPELATPEHIPHADKYLPGPPAEALAAEPIHANTFVALVTRKVKLDQEILLHILDTPARYIGVMGSRRRWTHTSKLLRETGLADADFAHVRSPLGLDIHADTPAEIAVSIMAEIIKAKGEG